MLIREDIRVNRKTIYRILKRNRWFVTQRVATPRPRAAARRSVAPASNVRWAMDVTHISCGKDGWADLAAVIDCHERELIGYEFALRGRAREAERALEEAVLPDSELSGLRERHLQFVYCKLRIPQVAKRIPHFCREDSPELQKAIADPWVGRLLSW